MERLRANLADLSLQFESSERLPVSVSVGICFFPVNGESVTTLLSAVVVTLEDAKASGGDLIRVAEAKTHAPAHAKTFDILQGLVIAVDTKDRYTRRHSEDVARYADFLAERLDLDPEMKRALHTAGLLHDVGKIGIPDTILRKPGPLTDDEFEIVKQHVTLGDMIVRDLPEIEVIRAGVRHHHERWDGRGYVDRLTGEDDPARRPHPRRRRRVLRDDDDAPVPQGDADRGCPAPPGGRLREPARRAPRRGLRLGDADRG